MVQSEPHKNDVIVKKEDLQFAVDVNIENFRKFLGNIYIDYRISRFLGSGFDIRFKHSSCC